MGLFIYEFLMKIQLIYSIVCSDTQQNDSVICLSIYLCILFRLQIHCLHQDSPFVSYNLMGFIFDKCNVHTHTNILFQILFHYKLLKIIEYLPLCYMGPCFFLIYFIDSSVYLLVPNSQFIPAFLFGNHKIVFYI